MERNIMIDVLFMTLLLFLFSCAKQPVVEEPLLHGLYVEKRVIVKSRHSYIIKNIEGKENR
jgi:hypothetical protein